MKSRACALFYSLSESSSAAAIIRTVFPLDTAKAIAQEQVKGIEKKIWLFRSLSSACVHAAFSSTPCESALSSRASESTKRQ